VLVCRHDILLYVANVDTPGEQQKYTIALIEHLFGFLPPTSTVEVLYDIGCVLERSLNNVSVILLQCNISLYNVQYDILPDSIMTRLRFTTSAMHAYGHQWACQLNYNPRLRPGLGLTDGEGVERLWSKLRKLIPLTRSSSVCKFHCTTGNLEHYK